MSAYDTIKNECSNCYAFDNSKHKQDLRTSHAGICKYYTCVVFKSDTCKAFMSVQQLPDFPTLETQQKLNL